MPFDPLHDARVRKAAFDWLAQQVSRHGDVLPWKVLSDGFQFDGVRLPLVGPQGIFRPRVLEEVPLSITTVYGGPYDDSFGSRVSCATGTGARTRTTQTTAVCGRRCSVACRSCTSTGWPREGTWRRGPSSSAQIIRPRTHSPSRSITCGMQEQPLCTRD